MGAHGLVWPNSALHDPTQVIGNQSNRLIMIIRLDNSVPVLCECCAACVPVLCQRSAKACVTDAI